MRFILSILFVLSYAQEIPVPDENRDKKITATEMNKYLNSHVPSQAKTMGREQHPQLLGSDLNRTILRY